MPENYPQTNGFNEIKAERWYENKVTFLIAILTPVIIILAFIFGMKTDIALIQQNIAIINTNHEAHIQDILQQIKDIQTDQKSQQVEIIDLQKQILLIINRK